MADWRQIKARVRKAKASADPAAALDQLYQRTRDAMVAFELAAVLEKAEQRDQAVKWYRTAFDRFRRGTWKRKAGEALVRLGEEVDLTAIPEDAPRAKAAAAGTPPVSGEAVSTFEETQIPLGDTEPDSLSSEPVTVGDLEAAALLTEAYPAAPGEAAPSAPGGTPGPKRRRGRRGGRGRRRGKTGDALPAAAYAPVPAPPPVAARPSSPAPVSRIARPAPARPAPAPEPEPALAEHAVGTAYAERSGRAGDPGMASRLAKLEAQLRRLLACPEHSMDDLDFAPAGPGVFLVSDSDQVSYYYIEACRTLSIALNQMVRGRSSTGSIKTQLAEHLGITETKVGAYIKQHCVVRWIQLDEDASKLAHFAIAVLRPALNE